MRFNDDGADAVDAFTRAVESLGAGLSVQSGVTDERPDLVVVMSDGRSITVEVKATSLVSGDTAPGQLLRWSSSRSSGVVGVVVADRITAAARDDLNRAGWSWLDLRGHLRLTGPGLFVDSNVLASAKRRSGRAGISGQVGIELAALLLLDPTKRTGVRAAAAALSRAPSSVSEALAALRAADLVDESGEPVVPGLFWELADHWRPVGLDVARVPGPGNNRDNAALNLGLDEIESTVGWALADTVAANHYGAPMAMRADYPPDFYVPDQATLRRATKILGSVPTPALRAGRVQVAPVSLVCSRRVDGSRWTNEPWPLAHPLFVALDLSRDPGRGREVLDGWAPRKPWNRVW